jgi:hypothetical protein
MNIIATNGFKRSGKGATANAIEANILVGKVKQVGFADKVKIFGARALGFLDRTDQELIDLMDLAKEHWVIGMAAEAHGTMPPLDMGGLTGRQYLQNVGTEARKIFGDDFWVDQVLPNPAKHDQSNWQDYVDDDLEDLHPGIDWLLITDLRFENEAQRVLDLGGEVWHVSRVGTDSDGHASEIPLPKKYISREINNDGTLDDLNAIVAENVYYFEGSI